MYPTLPHREGRLIPFVISSRHLLARIPGFHPGKGRSILPGRTSIEGEGISQAPDLEKLACYGQPLVPKPVKQRKSCSRKQLRAGSPQIPPRHPCFARESNGQSGICSGGKGTVTPVTVR